MPQHVYMAAMVTPLLSIKLLHLVAELFDLVHSIYCCCAGYRISRQCFLDHIGKA